MMYRFEIKFNYLYAIALIFLLVGMALWSFAPPRPSALVSGEINLSPDTNVELAKFLPLVATPSHSNDELGQKVRNWLQTQNVRSVDEATQWVYDHFEAGIQPFFIDVFYAMEYLMEHPGEKVGAICDTFTDAWLLLLQVKGLAKAGLQAVVKVRDPTGHWNGADHAVGLALSWDEKTLYVFYSWPYGYYSVSYYDSNLQFGPTGCPSKMCDIESFLKNRIDAFPTQDGAYDVDKLLAGQLVFQPINASTSSGGFPVVNGHVIIPVNNLIMPVDLGAGGLSAFIKNNKLIMEAKLQADWPHASEVPMGLSGEVYKVFLTVMLGNETRNLNLRVDMWSPACRNYRIYQLKGEVGGNWIPLEQAAMIQGGPDYFYTEAGKPTDHLGGDVPTAIWRNYDLLSNGSYYTAWDMNVFKPYLLPPSHPRVVTLVVGYLFPSPPRNLTYGNSYIVIPEKWIGVVKLLWDTETGSATPVTAGKLLLLLNQDKYAPGERATAWIKANTSISNVEAKVAGTDIVVKFSPDNSAATVWKAEFNVPTKEGVYELQAQTSLGYVSRSFVVTSNQQELNESRQPIVIKFDRDPPIYNIGEQVVYNVIVNVNGTYKLSSYVTGPTGGIEAVPLQKVDSIWQGVYMDTVWPGDYKVTVVLNGTGCVFYDKASNNVKAKAMFTVKGMPTSIKVWFDRTAYKPGSTVKVFASVNPLTDKAVLILEDGSEIFMQFDTNSKIFTAEFTAPDILGEHYVTVQAGGTAVRASFIVSNEDVEPTLILVSDRDKYMVGDTATLHAYLQNGIWGWTIVNPTITVSTPSFKKVQLDVHQDGDHIWGTIQLKEAGTYHAYADLNYTQLLQVKKLHAETTFSAVGNATMGGINLGSWTQPNDNVYNWLVNHGVPEDLARILAMPITWIILGLFIILLASRRGSYSYSGRYRL